MPFLSLFATAWLRLVSFLYVFRIAFPKRVNDNPQVMSSAPYIATVTRSKLVLPIHPVAKGTSERQNSNSMFDHITAALTRRRVCTR